MIVRVAKLDRRVPLPLHRRDVVTEDRLVAVLQEQRAIRQAGERPRRVRRPGISHDEPKCSRGVRLGNASKREGESKATPLLRTGYRLDLDWDRFRIARFLAQHEALPGQSVRYPIRLD